MVRRSPRRLRWPDPRDRSRGAVKLSSPACGGLEGARTRLWRALLFESDAERIFHRDVIARSTITESDFEPGPAARDARLEQEVGALQPKPQQPFERHAVHPSG